MIRLRFALPAIGLGLALTSTAVAQAQPLAAGHAKFLGGIYSTAQAPNLTNYFNQVTPENAGKWGSVEGTRDVMNWGELDAAYALAKDNGFPFRFHVLVWGNQQPNWIAALPAAEQLEEIKEWFDAVAARYPAIDYLEVVNEPINDPPDEAADGGYINALGTSGAAGTAPAVRWNWIVNAFRLARERFPATTKLVLNEYSVINDNNRTQDYLHIINLLRAENLVDVVAEQAHAFSTRGSTTQMKANLDLLAATGVPLMITEMDIDDDRGGATAHSDAVQLEDYQRVFPLLWEHPGVIGITLWGYRPGLWRDANGAFLVRADGSERPALVWLREYLANEAPVIPAGQVFDVPKGSVAGRKIGIVRAADAQPSTRLRDWTVTGGSGASVFAVNAATGRITLADAAALDAMATTSVTLTLTVSDGVRISEPETITINVHPEATAMTRLMAISTRARAGRDAQTLIMGFVIEGSAHKDVLLRGIGPTLSQLGVQGPLTDPQLQLYRYLDGAFALEQGNDNWGGSAELSESFTRLGAAPPLPTDSKDAALLRPMEAGIYTAHVTSPTAEDGVALVEAYDADTNSANRFTALSTRTTAGSGEDTLIAGLVLGGTGAKTMLIRGVGSSLVPLGVPIDSALADAKIVLYRWINNVWEVKGENDDWGGSTELLNVAAAVGANALTSPGSKDAALLITLEPGIYTAHVTSPSSASGVALVEIYDVQ